jgi:hypothetical protein
MLPNPLHTKQRERWSKIRQRRAATGQKSGDYSGYRLSLEDDENIPELDNNHDCTI